MKKNQKTYDNLLFIILFSFVIFFLFKNYNKLGLFADDIGTIYQLNKELSIKELIIYSHYWDAGRDLHLIWQKIFINISKPNLVENIHFFQFLLYFFNALLLFYFLNCLKIERKIASICSVIYIFFPVYAEVAFWTHAFSMVLMSTFFFLIFIIINFKIFTENEKKKNIFLECLSIIFLLLNLFTYEQSIATCYAIILLRQILKIKFKNIKIYKTIFISAIYGIIILLFSYYKLNESGLFANNTNELYFTGSSIVETSQIIKNIIHSYAFFITNIFLFNFSYFFKTLFVEKLFFIGITILFFFIFSKLDKKKFKTIDNYFILILICFLLYTISFIPLYIHYISDRHFYIPAIFAVVGLAFTIHKFMEIIENKDKIKKVFFSLLFIFLINCIVNFDITKMNYIKNYNLKKNFYKEISNLKKRYKKNIHLIDFPDLNNKVIFFAHEQVEAMKIYTGNELAPKIFRGYIDRNEFAEHDFLIPAILANVRLIRFKAIKKNKIIYSLSD